MNTDPNFRALCAELVELDQTAPRDFGKWKRSWIAATTRARAALATPPPEPPTDEELSDLWTIYDGIVDLRDFVVVARAVLERWGHS
jgi:hypothetical protein